MKAERSLSLAFLKQNPGPGQSCFRKFESSNHPRLGQELPGQKRADEDVDQMVQGCRQRVGHRKWRLRHPDGEFEDPVDQVQGKEDAGHDHRRPDDQFGEILQTFVAAGSGIFRLNVVKI